MQACCRKALAALAVLTLAPAAASQEPLQLSVVRSGDAAGCPDTAALRQQIRALQRPDGASRDIRVDAQFFRQEGLLTATLRISGDHTGSRTLSDPGPSCGPLADAVALTLAMLLDPSSSPLPPAPAPTPTPAPAPAPAPTPAPPAAPPGPPPAIELGAAALLTTGLTASPAAGLTAGAGLAGRSWRGGLRVAWLPARAFELAPGALDVSLLAGLARGCWVRGLRSLELGACMQLGAGRYQAEARGYSRNLDPGAAWVGGGASGLLGGAVQGPLRWEFELGWLASARRRAFRIEGVGLPFDPSPWGGLWVTLGLVVRPGD
ncbi:MAG: hypothetical protein MUF64_07060 [Polyangiaceae bacterium]|jgi:hypothetical protein|nr:hypothetical protein [Polyangiaceae bacterium]